jgi:hypothetical protein
VLALNRRRRRRLSVASPIIQVSAAALQHAKAGWRRSRGTVKLGSRSRSVAQAAATALHLHKTSANAAAARRDAHSIFAGSSLWVPAAAARTR